MALTNAGRDQIAATLVGEVASPFDNSNAYLGVGNGSGAFAATQTDLLGASKLRKGMEAGYPQRAGNVLTHRAVFGTSEANFAWEEWGLFNASSGGTMLNRKAETLGTKTSAQSWQITTTLTVNAS